MTDLLAFVCTVCSTFKAFAVPPAVGAICPVCSSVDSQQKVLAMVVRHEEDPPGIEVNFQLL